MAGMSNEQKSDVVEVDFEPRETIRSAASRRIPGAFFVIVESKVMIA
jgi:hypothetical protein